MDDILSYVERAISYARASQDRTGEELSVGRQHEDHRVVSQLRDAQLVTELTDNDISAAGRRKRPGFEAALEMVQRGEATVIIATDMSRLTRGKARDEARLLELGLETGLKLWFKRAPDLDLSSAAGRLTASILIAAARHEIEQKSERQIRAAEQAAVQGRRTSGRRAFGYGVEVGVDAVTGKPIIDYDALHPEESVALRDAYHAYLAGVPVGRLAKMLNEAGLFPAQGTRDGRPSRWTAQNLGPVMLNPRNAGLRVHTTEAVRKSMHPIKARLASIVGPAAWPALIDEPTWRATVAKMTGGKRYAGRSPQRFLTGVARCGTCDATVHGWKNKLGQPAYRCSADYGHLGRKLEPVDAYVNEYVAAYLSRPEFADLLRADEPDDLAAWREELRQLRGRLDEQAVMHAEGYIDTAQLRAGTVLLRKQMEAVEKKLTTSTRSSLLSPFADSADPADVWSRLDTDRRRAIVDHLFVIRLLPPGQGSWKFRPETVEIKPRSAT